MITLSKKYKSKNKLKKTFSMNFCTQCGTKIVASWNVCPNCGHNLKSEIVNQQPTQPQIPKQTYS